MITLYFDGHCQICSTSILYYKNILKNQLEIKDFNDSQVSIPAEIRPELAKQMYVSIQGHFLGGLAAWQVIWGALPSKYWGWKLLLGLSYVPGIKQIMQLGYLFFARHRHLLNF